MGFFLNNSFEEVGGRGQENPPSVPDSLPNEEEGDLDLMSEIDGVLADLKKDEPNQSSLLEKLRILKDRLQHEMGDLKREREENKSLEGSPYRSSLNETLGKLANKMSQINKFLQ